jgi:hypothetical protein
VTAQDVLTLKSTRIPTRPKDLRLPIPRWQGGVGSPQEHADPWNVVVPDSLSPLDTWAPLLIRPRAFSLGILVGARPSSGVASHIVLEKQQVLEINERTFGGLIAVEDLLSKSNVRCDAS